MLFFFLGITTLALGTFRAITAITFFTGPSFAVAVLLFLFTSGPYRRLAEFRALHEAAGRLETKAGHLLEHPGPIGESQALLLASEYHLARKGAPLLPAFVWRLRKGRLNRLWQAVAQEQPRCLKPDRVRPKSLSGRGLKCASDGECDARVHEDGGDLLGQVARVAQGCG